MKTLTEKAISDIENQLNKFDYDGTFEKTDKLNETLHTLGVNYGERIKKTRAEFEKNMIKMRTAYEAKVQEIINHGNYKPSQSIEESTTEDLIAALYEKFEKERTGFWPNAPTKDYPVFEHINLAIDMNEGKVVAETAAKDKTGQPLYRYTTTP